MEKHSFNLIEERYIPYKTEVEITNDYVVEGIVSEEDKVDIFISCTLLKKEPVSEVKISDSPELVVHGPAVRIYKSKINDDEKDKKNILISFSKGVIAIRKTNESFAERFWSVKNRSMIMEVENSQYIAWILSCFGKCYKNVMLRHFIIFDLDDILEIVAGNLPEIKNI